MNNLLVSNFHALVPEKCLDKKCKAEGCAISMKGIKGDWKLINLDCKQLSIWNKSRCDYLFLNSASKVNWIVPIEFKIKINDPKQIVKQLQGGANFADKFLRKKIDINFKPILAFKRSSHRLNIKKLRRNHSRINFRKNHYEIVLVKCSSSLVTQLK